MTDTDWLALADDIDSWAEADEANARNYSMVTTASTLHERAGDLRAAADGLRHLAAITAAIGDPDELDRLAKILRGFGATLWADHIGLIADAASLTPTPTPDSDGSNG